MTEHRSHGKEVAFEIGTIESRAGSYTLLRIAVAHPGGTAVSPNLIVMNRQNQLHT